MPKRLLLRGLVILTRATRLRASLLHGLARVLLCAAPSIARVGHSYARHSLARASLAWSLSCACAFLRRLSLGFCFFHGVSPTLSYRPPSTLFSTLHTLLPPLSPIQPSLSAHRPTLYLRSSPPVLLSPSSSLYSISSPSISGHLSRLLSAFLSSLYTPLRRSHYNACAGHCFACAGLAPACAVLCLFYARVVLLAACVQIVVLFARVSFPCLRLAQVVALPAWVFLLFARSLCAGDLLGARSHFICQYAVWSGGKADEVAIAWTHALFNRYSCNPMLTPLQLLAPTPLFQPPPTTSP